MAYVNRVLLDGEVIERRPSVSRMATFGAPTVEFVLMAGGWTLIRWLVLQPWLAPENPTISRILFWAYVLGMALFTARLIVRLVLRGLELFFTEIAVTNRRFMEKTGVFSVSFYGTDLEKIVKVAIEQSLLGRLFDYGAVTIVTIGEVSHTTEDVAAPIVLQQALHRRMHAEQSASAQDRRADSAAGSGAGSGAMGTHWRD